MLKYEDSRPMLADQLKWFVRAIAASAWRWRQPFTFDDEEETRAARARAEALLDALFYGVLEAGLVYPVEINPYQIFDEFFAELTEDKDSLHLAETLAARIMKALES